VWHASTALIGRDGTPIDLTRVSIEQMRAMKRIALGMLDGVGGAPLVWTETRSTLHLRRPLTDAEIAGLDPAWVALPAIDMG
jgi:hypothetical protein